MNILFTIGSYNSFGGTEKITTVLANAFALRGFQVSIAAFREQCNAKKLGLTPTIKTFELESIPLRKILQEEKIDIIINQWCLPYKTTRLINKARKGLNIKLISALHGVPDKSKISIIAHEKNKILGWIVDKIIAWNIRLVVRNSDKYVLLANGFINNMPVRSNKIAVIGNPITIENKDLVIEEKDKTQQVLYVGRMDKENKRVNRILEAWEQIFKKYPKWSLMLIGDGPHLNELKTYAQSKRIERVTFTGFVQEEEIIRQYKQSKIFLLTSDLEGFGLVLVEAMNFGVVPIVYGSYVAVHDIIDNGINGIITQYPYSQDATINALKKLMNNPELLQKMSNAALEKSKEFTLDNILKKWEDLFHNL